MRRALLAVIAILCGLLFPAVYETNLDRPVDTARALPSLSGALPASVPNGDFAGLGLGEVGTPPPNYGFETPEASVGSPPSNHDFASGNFTGWTLTGTPTVQSGGPGGYYAQLGSGQKILSSAFTVASTAQALTFNVASATTGQHGFYLNIYSGPTYATKTSKFFSCSSGCTTDWIIRKLDAVPWQGQSIKVEVQRVAGTINVDDAATGQRILADWAPTAGDKISRETGGPGGAFAKSSTPIVSQAYTVDANGQNGQLDVKVEGASGTYDVYVLSGPSYATSTKVFTGSQADSASWSTKTFGLGDFAGQSVKFKVVPGISSTVAVDKAAITRHEVPGWSATGADPIALAQDTITAVRYLDHVAVATSGAVFLTFPAPHGTGYATWAHIVYRMKSNLNAQNNDVGSTLQVWYGSAKVWQRGGNGGGTGGADPADVWLERYFLIEDSVTTPASFRIQGWGPTFDNPTNGGRPDVALLEVVDGPGQNKILGNPLARTMAYAPPDLAFEIVTDVTQDPVEVTSGNYTQSHTDLAIPGRGVPLTFTRTYSAQTSSNGLGVTGPLGIKWSHNWQASLTELNSGYTAQVRLPAGSSQTWNKVSGSFVPPPGFEGSLVKNPGGDWTLTTRHKLVYAFDANGRWTSVTDRNGNATTLAYDGNGRLSTIADPGGRSLTLTYGTSGNGNGRIVSISDGARTVSYGYSSDADLTTITDVMGGTIAYQYAGHLLTQGTDAKGNVFVRNTYDLQGRVTQQLDAQGGTTTIAYSTPGDGATRITDQRGKQTTYYFDQQMRITDVVDHNGGTTTTVYDSGNNRTAVTNALGKTWTYTYDANGNVLTATDPLAKTWTYTYDGFNNVLTATDPLSRVTTYAYDANGALTSVTDAASEVTSFTVNGQGLVTAVTDPLSHTTSFAYDSYGNRTSVTNALAKTWTFAYDAAGRVTSATDPLGHTTSYTYNAANLALTATDALSHVTTYTYDANGNVLTVEDANGNTATYAYNNRDQLTSVTDAEDGVWSFAYDAVGNLASKTNPRGKTTTYAYDNLSRLASETDPLSHVRSYSYDAAGRLTSRTDPESQTVSYTYNNRNELTNITYPDLSYVSFAYNDAGARTQMVDATGTTSYSYDNLYRLTGVTFPGSRTVSYGYDDAGRRTSLAYPGGTNQVTYGYDAANRLTAVTDWNLATVSYAYDDAGRMTTKTLPAGTGVVSSYAYDNADRLTGIAHVKDGQTTIASVAYTLDDVGNRTGRVDQQGTHSYAYDDLYRLTGVTYPGPNTTSYAFDAFGNRTSMTNGGGTTTYAYDDADRLTAVTPPSPAPVVSYTWDDNGNLTARGSDSFAWDYEDRMVSATVNSVTTTFAYRGDGLRDSRTTGLATTTFTWDIAAGLPVVLDDGSQYVYGAGLESLLTATGAYYYLADGLGSTMAMVDSAGAVAKAYTYDVYGKPTATGALANEFDFAAQQTDPTGLQYLRARYMDVATGTFLSRDPLSSLPSWHGHPFGYGLASPAAATDPSGLTPPEACGTYRWCVADLDYHPESAGPVGFVEYMLLGDGSPLYRVCHLVGEYKMCSGADAIEDPISEILAGFEAWLDDLMIGLGVIRDYRAGLVRRTGADPKDSDAHHVFPKAFRDRFARSGIDIDDPRYLEWWEAGTHRTNSGAYNKLWRDFFKGRPDATSAEILDFGRRAMGVFGRSVSY